MHLPSVWRCGVAALVIVGGSAAGGATGCGGAVTPAGETSGGAGGRITGGRTTDGTTSGSGANGSQVATGSATGTTTGTAGGSANSMSGQGGATPGSGVGPGMAVCSPNAGSSVALTFTNPEYDNTIRDLLGYEGSPSQDFELPPDYLGGFAFLRETLDADSTHRISHYVDAAAKIAASVVGRGLDKILPCDPQADGEDPCAETFIASFGKSAWRRPLTDAERGALVEVYADGRASGSFLLGIQSVIATLLASPEFYEIERPGKANEVTPLTPYAVATRLSYFLTRSTPDSKLLAAAEAGVLSTRDGVEAEARRLLSTSGAHAAVADFFRQWLELDRLDSIDKPSFPDFAAESGYVKTETELFGDSIFFGGGPWSDLLLGTRTFLNEPIALLYGQTDVQGLDFRAATVNPTQRSGLLTQASILAMGAYDESSPTYRGLFVRRHLLCSEIPPPPASVLVIPPDLPGLTVRERLEEWTSNTSCQSCHSLMDPIGFGFEHFDAVGRYRADYGSQPIDATGKIAGSGPDLAGTFDGALELSSELAASTEVPACLVTQWFRFALLREPTEEDRCSMDAAASVLARKGSLADLAVNLATSDSFRYARW